MPLRLRSFNRWLGRLSQTISLSVVQNLQADSETLSYGSRYKSLLLALVLIFSLSISVRLLHWQDKQIDFQQKKSLSTALVTGYEREAKRMLEQGGVLYPSEPMDSGDARMLVHPPGYSIIVALSQKVFADRHTGLRLTQVICDSMAALLVFLIAAELLPFAAALVGGALVALSPHLAGYSLWLSADSLAVLPILLSVYLIVRAIKKPRLVTIIGAGAFVGLSCWIRSNALLLAFFLAAAIFLLINRGDRLRYSVAFIAAFILVIAPITIRNIIVFDSFIPLSLGAGITLIEGIADYDTDKRFGMPQFDKDVALKEAEWHNRPDYAGNLWRPDGVEREKARFARGLAVIRSNPGWFSTVMLRRAGFMLRYNDAGASNWPLNTSQAPVVSSEPGFSHNLAAYDHLSPVWTSSPADLMSQGSRLSSRAKIELADNQSLEITGDDSLFADLFASAPIAVRQNTDYTLALPVEVVNQGMAIKVTSADYRRALASQILDQPVRKKNRRAGEEDKREVAGGEEEIDSNGDESMTSIALRFASGNRTEVRLVISNNQPSSLPPLVRLGEPQLIELGSTAYLWTRWPRSLISGFQRNLFKTNIMLALISVGVILLALARRKRALVILLAVPLYYLCAQSALHTEYRYILAIHYFLFIAAAVTLYFAGAVIVQISNWVIRGRAVDSAVRG